MDVRHYIKDLLYLHDCVIIPGFGGFVTGYQSSEIHKFKNLIYPPSKTIMFNRRLQTNDGVVINYIAQQDKLSYQQAEENVKQFSIWWNRLLENKGIVIFPDVGKLYINSSNVLVFLPELRKNYLTETFGLKPVAFHSQLEVVSVKDTKAKPAETIDETEYAERLRIKRKRRTRLAAAAVLIGALLLASQLFLQNFLPERIRIEQLNILDSFKIEKCLPSQVEPTKIESADKGIAETSASLSEGIEEKDSSAQIELVTDTVSGTTPTPASAEINETSNSGNYYIILGEFEYISDAIRTKKQLDSNYGKTLEVFSSEGTYLIGLFSGTKKTAEALLPQFEISEFTPRIMMRETPL